MTEGSYFGPKKTSTTTTTTTGGGSLDQGKIFVGGLSWQTTEESLRWHFEQYGPVISVEVMRDRVTGDPRGFAFVVFREPTTVDLVMNEAKHEINHKIVDVKRAQARGIAPPSIHEGGNKQQQPSGGAGGGAGHGPDRNNSSNNHHPSNLNSSNSMEDGDYSSQQQHELTPEQMHTKVFVGGIPAHIDRDELKTIFEQFGPVVDSIVMMDQVTNRSRCFGFVTFESGSNGAQRAIEAQPLQIGQRNVEVKLATPKADQPKRILSTTIMAAGPKHVGLRAGMSSSSSSVSGEYAGLAVAYGRSGWKAGYGSKAFGIAGWAMDGWPDGGPPTLARDGFSFELLNSSNSNNHKNNDHKNNDKNKNNHHHHHPRDSSQPPPIVPPQQHHHHQQPPRDSSYHHQGTQQPQREEWDQQQQQYHHSRHDSSSTSHSGQRRSREQRSSHDHDHDNDGPPPKWSRRS